MEDYKSLITTLVFNKLLGIMSPKIHKEDEAMKNISYQSTIDNLVYTIIGT